MEQFKNIKGYAEIKKKLYVITDYLNNPLKYKSQGAEFFHGLLLHGNVGVGKSAMAEALITASKCKSYTIRKMKSDGAFINHIEETFKEAKQYCKMNCHKAVIIYLDDIDHFPCGEDDMLRNAEEFTVIQSCIDECKDLPIFILATANRIDVIPDSLLRAGRIDSIIRVDTPKYADSVEIIKYYLSNVCSLEDDIDPEQLAKILVGKSCATLANIINKAAIQTTFEGRSKISMTDLIKASLDELFGANIIETEDYPYFKETVIHEIGHCLVANIVEPNSIVLVAVQNNDGDIKGLNIPFQSEEYFEDIKYPKNRILTLLGGMAATEVVLGKTDVGSIQDCSRAQKIIERLILEHKEHGFKFVESNSYPMSDTLLTQFEVSVSTELSTYYEQAKKIIREHRDKFDMLVEAVSEKKVLLQKDIQQIMKL